MQFSQNGFFFFAFFSYLRPIGVAVCHAHRRDDDEHHHKNWIGQEYVYGNLLNFDSPAIFNKKKKMLTHIQKRKMGAKLIRTTLI